MENVPNERLVDLVIFGWFDKIERKKQQHRWTRVYCSDSGREKIENHKWSLDKFWYAFFF
jgi:hypothetical protein